MKQYVYVQEGRGYIAGVETNRFGRMFRVVGSSFEGWYKESEVEGLTGDPFSESDPVDVGGVEAPLPWDPEALFEDGAGATLQPNIEIAPEDTLNYKSALFNVRASEEDPEDPEDVEDDDDDDDDDDSFDDWSDQYYEPQETFLSRDANRKPRRRRPLANRKTAVDLIVVPVDETADDTAADIVDALVTFGVEYNVWDWDEDYAGTGAYIIRDIPEWQSDDAIAAVTDEDSVSYALIHKGSTTSRRRPLANRKIGPDDGIAGMFDIDGEPYCAHCVNNNRSTFSDEPEDVISQNDLISDSPNTTLCSFCRDYLWDPDHPDLPFLANRKTADDLYERAAGEWDFDEEPSIEDLNDSGSYFDAMSLPCPDCGIEAPISASFCPSCDANLNDEDDNSFPMYANRKTTSWETVRNKAVMLRNNGNVSVQNYSPDYIKASVKGTNSTYEVEIVLGGEGANYQDVRDTQVSAWTCTCPWGEWAWKRENKYVGRMCSHAYAAFMEFQSLNYRSASKKTADNGLAIGDRVSHPENGTGTVVDRHWFNSDYKIKIEWDLGGPLVSGQSWEDESSLTKSALAKTAVNVHYFEDGSEDAYDQTQYRDDIDDGDVLVVPGEGVVGFLNKAWPIAVTQQSGEFHRLTTTWENFLSSNEGAGYEESVAKAKSVAQEMGLAVTSSRLNRAACLNCGCGDPTNDHGVPGNTTLDECPSCGCGDPSHTTPLANIEAPVTVASKIGLCPQCSGNWLTLESDYCYECGWGDASKKDPEVAKELFDQGEEIENPWLISNYTEASTGYGQDSYETHTLDGSLVEIGEFEGYWYATAFVDGGSLSREDDIEYTWNDRAFLTAQEAMAFVEGEDLSNSRDFPYTSATNTKASSMWSLEGVEVPHNPNDSSQYGFQSIGTEEIPEDELDERDTELEALSPNASSRDIIAQFQASIGSERAWDGNSGGNDDIAGAANSFLKEAGKVHTPQEQLELIDEPGVARNLSSLNLDDTHYLAL